VVDKQLQEEERPIWRTGRFIVYAALLVGFIVLRTHEANATARIWLFFLGGCALTVFAISGLKSGSTWANYSLVRRSEEPTKYWITIVIEGVLGVCGIVATLGTLFGWWALPR
jgi:hypothetical protein